MKVTDNLFVATILIYQTFFVYGEGLPPEVQKCKSTNNDDCVVRPIEKVLQLYPNGNAELGISSIKALNGSNLSISRLNPSSPIQLSFNFIRCTMYGLDNHKILRATGFDKQFKHLEVDVLLPDVKIVGDYESKGKILLLPINGFGKGVIKFKNLTVELRAKAHLEERNGKTYAKIDDLKTVAKPRKLIVDLENILNGNPLLSESINAVTNENWEDIWSELKDGINEVLKNFLFDIIRKPFEKISIDDFYTD